MSIKGVLRHTGLELRELATHPLMSLGNSPAIVKGLYHTGSVGTKAIHTLKEQFSNWTYEERGRFLWEVAAKEWASQILTYAGIDVRVHGEAEVDWSQNYVVAVNHQSALDIVPVVKYVRNGRFVVKVEALKLPVIGPAAALGSQIIVNREDGSGMDAVRAGMKDWTDCNIIFFVEGTRSLTGSVQEFKAGAFKLARELGWPILPLYLEGMYHVLPKGPFLALQRNQRVSLSFGKPIQPSTTVGELRIMTTQAMCKMAKDARALR